MSLQNLKNKNLSGAQILCAMLVHYGVDTIFGYPGGANLPIYDALYKSPKLKHILVRHEQAAAHAAEGYAWTTGKPGICFATSGPGATNLVTGLADAMLDSIPVIAITGQVVSSLIGTDAFQETDVTGVTLPVTKHNFLITKASDIAQIIEEAFAIATSGRPGPVLIDIAKDAQAQVCKFVLPKPSQYMATKVRTHASEEEITKLAQLINNSQRPLIVAGHGILSSKNPKTLIEFASKQDIPITLTHMGLSAVASDHRLFMGSPGMHGNVAANKAPQEADLIIGIGMRFHDRVTGKVSSYAPYATKVHIDIDPSEINKNVSVDLGIVGDANTVLMQTLPKLKSKQNTPWLTRFAEWKKEEQLKVWDKELNSSKLIAAQVIDELSTQTGGEAIIVPDVGQNQMYAARYYKFRRYNSFYYSGGLGTMGFAVPCAIGAKIANPSCEVWAVVGDGGFQMTIQELATIAQEKLDLKIALLNNSYLGMVRQWQELFYKGNYSGVFLKNPDFQTICKGFGINSIKVKSLKEAKQAIKKARQVKGPYLVEFVITPEENVFPMIPAGAGIDGMVVEKSEIK